MGRDRGGPALHPGQGHRQLDQHEGRRRAVQAAGQAGAPVWRRRRGDGLRRARPGRHLPAQDRDLRAGLPAAGRRSRLSARGHHLRPEHLRDRDRHRGTRQLRGRLHQRHPLDQEEPARRQGVGRRQQRELQLPRQRPGARSDPHGVPVPRDPGGHGHGHRQRRHGRRLRRPRTRIARAGRGRGAQPPSRRRGTAGRGGRDCQERRQGREQAARMARHARATGACRPAARPCDGARHHRLHRRGHRGGLPAGAGTRRPAAARHRRAAHGRHERGRRPVRAGQDVPAAGGQVGARDEVGSGPPHSVHRGRKAPGRGRRARRSDQGQDHHRHRQGRRSRHRQEHRDRGPAVQQLRGREHGRDGSVPRDPGARQGRGRGHRRPLGPDHAQPRRDAICRRRDAEGRAFPHAQDPAHDRRRHHQPRPHRRQDRAALRGAGGVRAGRLAQRERGAVAAFGPGRGLHRRDQRRLRQGAPAARRQEAGAALAARQGARQQDADRLGRLPAAGAQVHRPPRVPQLRPGRTRPLHRLGSVLPDLGPGRALSGDPEGPGGGHRGGPGLCGRAADAQAPDRRPLADRERRGGLLASEHRERGRHRALHRRIPHRGGAHLVRSSPTVREARDRGRDAPEPQPRGFCRAARKRVEGLCRRIRRHRGTRGREEGEVLHGRPRRLLGHHAEGLGRPPGGSLCRGLAPARAKGPVGLCRQREPGPGRTDRREVPRHSPGAGLSGLPRPQRQEADVRPPQLRIDRHDADREPGDDAGGERERLLPRASRGDVLQRRQDRQGPAAGPGTAAEPGRKRTREAAGAQPMSWRSTTARAARARVRRS
ncbi:conserved hypothetical protein [Burkholderiales bacterium 8X]|nr:conserved hypothetical protein [Burkholderiales bacterium 8X]